MDNAHTYAIAAGVIALVVLLAVALWLWFAGPDEEALEKQRLSAQPYDTEVMNKAFDQEADPTSQERKQP